MKKRYWIPAVVLLILIITYFLGPKPPNPDYGKELPDVPNDLEQLGAYIQKREKQLPLREDNQARILWQQNEPQVTEYSVVYLHGFGGSYRDGYPVNVKIADTLGANLYLARWAGHGMVAGEALEEFSPGAAWESAKEALVVGEKIDKKVIIMSTSTGGTLAFKLAATYPDKVHALINLSPYIEDETDGAFLLNSPWGYELASLVSFGDHMKVEHEKEIAAQYFDTIYPSRALVDLQVLLGTLISEDTFRKVTSPVLTLYYYENFLEEDDHVEVEVYPEVHALLATPDSLKKLVRLVEPKNHFLGSEIKSENTHVVTKEIVEFLRETLKLEINSDSAEIRDLEVDEQANDN
ncbi:alpha/beta hydrolase [Salinimicrobium sediminilitoris]|uniref:alpha/beta hydrolase n=1 Tax=Salinimicrobium sediminilitoris TaxID=2876715 RepID=UPI001E29EF7F|nr:alpha/beta hydrolase [Salinimicrobium sediminilitoris]MCC8360001.1 alpha/beta hydrolase [Salinimicrobium sediminilitoris]